MVETSRLRGIIAERGYSQRQVAKYLGMTEKTFYTKMKKGSFGIDEAAKMIELLEIKEPTRIFFAQLVTQQDT